jgi:hypothetical protein
VPSKRAVEFGPHYRAALIGFSEARRSIGRTARALEEAETLPGPNDVHGLVPVPGSVDTWANGRHVPRTGGLWLWYVVRADGSLLLFALTRTLHG